MGCAWSKQSCRSFLVLFSKRATPSSNEHPMKAKEARADRNSHESIQSPHRAIQKPQRARSELATNEPHLSPNGHANLGEHGGSINFTMRNLDAAEWPGQTVSGRPSMLVDTDTAQRPPESNLIGECNPPQHLQSSIGPSTPNYENVIRLIESLRLKVDKFVARTYNLPTEAERSKTRTQIYRPVIDLVQDREANSNPKACMYPHRPSQSLAFELTPRSNR